MENQPMTLLQHDNLVYLFNLKRNLLKEHLDLDPRAILDDETLPQDFHLLFKKLVEEPDSITSQSADEIHNRLLGTIRHSAKAIEDKGHPTLFSVWDDLLEPISSENIDQRPYMLLGKPSENIAEQEADLRFWSARKPR